MSFNDVMLFGRLARDVEIRKLRSGTEWAKLEVKTYRWVRDSLTGKAVLDVTIHDVHCHDDVSIGPLKQYGKAGSWIRVKGDLTYNKDRTAFIRVMSRGGMATVSAYFGTEIGPENMVPKDETPPHAVADQSSSQPEPETDDKPAPAPAQPHIQETPSQAAPAAASSAQSVPAASRSPLSRMPGAAATPAATTAPVAASPVSPPAPAKSPLAPSRGPVSPAPTAARPVSDSFPGSRPAGGVGQPPAARPAARPASERNPVDDIPF